MSESVGTAASNGKLVSTEEKLTEGDVVTTITKTKTVRKGKFIEFVELLIQFHRLIPINQ